jgi:hypothetical protein
MIVTVVVEDNGRGVGAFMPWDADYMANFQYDNFARGVDMQKGALTICRHIPDRNQDLLNEIEVGLDELLQRARGKDAEFWTTAQGTELFDKLEEFHEAIVRESRRGEEEGGVEAGV